MNYSQLIYSAFDGCAIIISILVLLNYFISKHLTMRTAIFFQFTIACSSIYSCCSFIFMILRCVYATPTWLLNTLLCLKYLFCILACLMYFAYSLAVNYENRKPPMQIIAVIVTIGSVGIIGVIISAIALGLQAIWLRPLCLGLIYGCQLVTLLVALFYTYLNRKHLSAKQSMNSSYFTSLMIFATILQYFKPQLQICAFALSIAILLIYVTLQRPEDELDADTGMFNYKTFTRRANVLIKANLPFYVFVTEIKNMSVVNSTYGVLGGNQVLKQFTARLKAIAGKNYYLYRLNGVKAAIIFNTLDECRNYENKYLSVFKKPFAVGNEEIELSALACVIKYPDVAASVGDIDDIVRYYRSSATSTDPVINAEKEALERSKRREQVDYAIQRAINQRSFEVYYQPIYSVKKSKFNSCEALVRLNDSQLGFISPDEFIPIAEADGRIVEVGRIVAEEVCKFLTENNPMELGLECVDVNLSVIQCMHPEIITDIKNLLLKYNLPQKLISLEITETASAQSYALLQSRLNELHTNGFTISLDDFGTGFSSVEYLINFPFDIVKLDKSLVWAYMSTEKYSPILQHYVPMLHGLGAKIVAEGVETREMAQSLIYLGCDYLQGYYYSRPIPKDKYMQFLRDNYNKSNVA